MPFSYHKWRGLGVGWVERPKGREAQHWGNDLIPRLVIGLCCLAKL